MVYSLLSFKEIGLFSKVGTNIDTEVRISDTSEL